MKIQKINMRTLFIILSFIFGIQVCFGQGNEGGHAGDLYADEFIFLGKELSKVIDVYEKKCKECFIKTDGKPFTAREYKDFVKENLNLKHVFSAENDDMGLNNKDVDAINFENGDTKINRDRWIGYNLWERIKLVNHEIFGHLNVERDEFTVSDQFTSMIDLTFNSILKHYDVKKMIPSYYIARNINYLGVIEKDPDCNSITEEQKEETREIALERCRNDKTLPPSRNRSCHINKAKEILEFNISKGVLGVRRCIFTVFASFNP